jgi:Tol biopolymer transport system component
VVALAAMLAVGYLVVGPYRPSVGGYLRTLRLAYNLAWSPDGSQLAFTVEVPYPLGPQDSETAVDLYVVGASGDGLRRLRERLPATLDPRWSPSGRELLIPAGSSPRQDRFEILDVGSGVSRAMPAPDGSAFDPRWSPDGRRILFTVGRAWSEERGWWARQDQWLVDADGRNVRNLSQNGSAVSGAWSPDGRSVVFTTQSDGGGSVMLTQVDGTGLRRIGDCCDAVWVDAGHLRLTRWSDEGSVATLVPTDGGPTLPLGTSDVDRTWSPDGRLYATWDWTSTLKVMSMKIMTPTAEPVWEDQGNLRSNGPLSWSPDGQALSLIASGPQGDGLYVLPLGATPRLALPHVVSWAATAWRPGQAAGQPPELAVVRGSDIVAVRADGSSGRLLARAPSPDDPPGASYLPGGRADLPPLPTSMSIDGHGPNAVGYDIRGERLWVTNGSAEPWVIRLASDGFFDCPNVEGATPVPLDWGSPACAISPGAAVELSIGGNTAGDGGAVLMQLQPGSDFDERRPLDVYVRLIPPDLGPPVSPSGSP